MSGEGCWEEGLWDRVPHLIKYSRGSIDWLSRHVKLAQGLQKLHKEYGKGLGKLVKTQRDRGSEGGSLGECWDGVMRQLGTVAARHKQLSVILEDIASQYQTEADILSEEQRNLEHNSKKVQVGLDAAVFVLEKAKEKFQRRQQEADKAEDALTRSEEDTSVDKSELDKLRDTADDKKIRANKAREEYSAQLIEANRKQRQVYGESWPTILSGMRSIAERSAECVASLVGRLDIAAREEWGDLASVSEVVSPEDDFDQFLSWARSGNLPPADFTFEEQATPGSSRLSAMGTLRRSLSRTSLRLGNSPAIARSGSGKFGSRFSLRNNGGAKEFREYNHRLKFASVKEESSSRHSNSQIQASHSDLDISMDSTTSNHANNGVTANGGSPQKENHRPASLSNGGHTVDHSVLEEAEEEEEAGPEDGDDHDGEAPSVVALPTPAPRPSILHSSTPLATPDGSPTKSKRASIGPPTAANGVKNGSAAAYATQPSYDDSMNPFTEDFEEE